LNKPSEEVQELDDIDDMITNRERTSVSVNLNDGYKFRFMRKMTTEIKHTEGIEKIKK
jgi:hypothetical protein